MSLFEVYGNDGAVELTASRRPERRAVAAGRCGRTRRRNTTSGQMIVIVSMAIVVLVGFAAMGVDVGQFLTTRRDAQTAADAGAVAGASALRLKQNPTKAAMDASSLNGFTNGSNSVTVTVNNPPKSGAYNGNSSYVEVIVDQTLPSFFMAALGFNKVDVNARAVGSSMNGSSCVYALDPSASSALSIGGSASMTLGCGAMVDSSNSTALTTNGGGALTAASIGVVGGYSGSGYSPTPVSGIAPAPDPLSYLTAPKPGTCVSGPWHITKDTTLNQGTYCNGIKIDAGIAVTFNSGLYILQGKNGLTTSGSATITGSGVTFFLTKDSSGNYGGVALSGSDTLHLSAPTSGTYEGILFYQDPTVPKGSAASQITGSSGSTFDGTLYFPTTALSYGGNSSSSGYTILVADTVSVTGNSTFGSNYSSLADGSPLKGTSLYE